VFGAIILLAFLFGAGILAKILKFSSTNSLDQLIFSYSSFYISLAPTSWEIIKIFGLKVVDFHTYATLTFFFSSCISTPKSSSSSCEPTRLQLKASTFTCLVSALWTILIVKSWNMDIHLPFLPNGSNTIASHYNGLWLILTTKKA
jgi:hypothetical protein